MKAPSLFVRLKQDFFGLFGAIWLLGGVLMLIIGLPLGVRSGDYTFAAVGLVLGAIGGRMWCGHPHPGGVRASGRPVTS